MTEIERQRKLEVDAVQDGILRYCRNREYAVATDSKPVRNLMTEALKPLSDAIFQEQVALKSPGRGRLPRYATAMLSIHHEKEALITLGMLLNSISRSELDKGLAPAVTAVASDIGQRCRLERLFDCCEKRQIDIADELHSRNRTRDAGRRAAELAKELDDDEEWAKNYRAFHLGDKLIALAVAHAKFEGQPIFELHTVRESDATRSASAKARSLKGGTRTKHRIALTAAAAEWLADHDTTLASLTPVYMPMILEPRPWTSLSDGGYLVTPLKLLKRQPSARGQKALKKANLSIVYSAVNAIQNTPWRINKDMYRIMHSWQVRDAANRNSQTKDPQMASRLAFAERMLDEPRFYFPHQLDHRGRAYPVPQVVNPQSDNAGKALLEFADGKPLGERGAYWLAFHIANCYWKKNKVSSAKRLKWVNDHEAEIIAFAKDPLGPHRIRDQAGKPWMFLRACLEWKGYREEGPDFLSHLPVSVDGTCNGYQHLSAMGRDPIGGSATNLSPGDDPEDDPEDMYQETADHACIHIMIDAKYGTGDDRDAALELLDKVDRSGVKHATMTTPYGVTRETIYKQLLEQEPVKSCKDPKKCARYLAKVLVECIPEVAVQAGIIMTYLREATGRLAKANRIMMWTTPTGFVVVHENREPKEVRVATSDWTFVLYEQDETRKIDVRKQVDGIVAHFVHSLDAGHMMLTVIRLVAEGLRHFAMVHDSFGVHACDIDVLNRVLREEFVRIYSEPVLQNFLNEQRAAHPDINLPEIPPTGDLDIRQVLDSPYFFA
jgi:DNA-directed RNA polymerase